MKLLNFYAGMIFLLVFFVSGWVLLNDIASVYADNAYVRMANRANHIYLFLITVLNMILTQDKWINRSYELLTRMILLLAGVLASVGFFIEQHHTITQRMLTPTAIGLVFVFLLLFAGNQYRVKKQL